MAIIKIEVNKGGLIFVTVTKKSTAQKHYPEVITTMKTIFTV